ncbi:MAG: chorismate mutase [Chloroflexi bacterium AL-W]|nr:chorismate mutase [Chloroflexi bacterium AL-W]
MMYVRGVRGAITVTADEEHIILEATQALLQAMINANDINEDEVASVFFTATPDLTAVYPARAARILGWTQTALMGMQEMAVRGGLPHCIRILIHWNTAKAPQEIEHIYLNDAVSLRPDRQNGVIRE